MLYHVIFFIVGLLIGLLVWLLNKNNSVPKSELDDLSQKLNQSEIQLALIQDRNQNAISELENYKKESEMMKKLNQDLIQENASLNANISKLEEFLNQLKAL